MRSGLYGGSFDPIHYGHVHPVRRAREVLGLERVVYLPTAHPPHKDGARVPALSRLVMVELALLDEPALQVSSLEMHEGAAYTVDTVEHFRRLQPTVDWVLLIGGDSLAGITTWRRWQRIVELVELAVMVRPGWETAEMVAELPAELREARTAGRLHFVDNPPLPISSTELRRQMAAGKLPEPDIVPPLVIDYIRKYDLYR